MKNKNNKEQVMGTDDNLAIDIDAKETSQASLKLLNTEDCTVSYLNNTVAGKATANDQYYSDTYIKTSRESSLRELFSGSRLNHASGLPRSHAAVDLMLVLTSFMAMHLVYLGHLNFTSLRTVALYGSIILIISSFSASGLYNNRKPQSLNSELVVLTVCWLCAFATVGLVAFLTKTMEISRIWITTSMILSFALLLSIRTFNLFRLVTNGKVKTRNVIICGDAMSITSAMQNLYKTPNARFRVLNSFEITTADISQQDWMEKLDFRAGHIADFIENQRQAGEVVDQVWIATSQDHSEIIHTLSNTLINSTVDICVVPDSYTEQLLNGESTKIGKSRIVNVSQISMTPSADTFKRIFDITLASVASVLLCIPMAIISVLIKMESSGPVIFRQKRYGIDGTEIDVFKFRSMHLHSDSSVVQAIKNDSRVTRVGKVLRRTSLDELPQLFNVLLGNMSIIGPRPHASAHNEAWRKKINGYMLRHKVRPGITGWAQVNGWRGETNTDFKMEQRVKHDLEYIHNWSPLLDIKIVFLTVFSLISNRDVY